MYKKNIAIASVCLSLQSYCFVDGFRSKMHRTPSICFAYDENKHIDLFPLWPQPKPYHPHYQFKPIMPFTKPNCGVTSLEPPKPSNIKNWLQYIYDSEEKSDSTWRRNIMLLSSKIVSRSVFRSGMSNKNSATAQNVRSPVDHIKRRFMGERAKYKVVYRCS